MIPVNARHAKTIAVAMFPEAHARIGVDTNLALVLRALSDRSLDDPLMFLVALGTIRAELGNFTPRSEGRSKFNTISDVRGRPSRNASLGAPIFSLPELGRLGPGLMADRFSAAPGSSLQFTRGGETQYVPPTTGSAYEYKSRLGNTTWGDGARYIGRGYVQMTGRHNYTLYGEEIDKPWLLRWPERANDPQIAAELLAAFLKGARKPARERDREYHEDKIRRHLEKGLYGLAAVRKAVNGGSNGLRDFVAAFQAGARMAFTLNLIGKVDLDRFVGRRVDGAYDPSMMTA